MLMRIATFSLLTILLSSCSTMEVHNTQATNVCGHTGYIYGGLISDGQMIFSVVNPNTEMPSSDRLFYMAYSLIDLPFSATFDTIALPIAIYRQIAEC